MSDITIESIDRRLTVLETEFKHLANKADLKSLEIRLAGLILLAGGLVISILRVLA